MRTIRRLAAEMFCGFCGTFTQVTPDLRCAECGR